jgi:hypothetical protein
MYTTRRAAFGYTNIINLPPPLAVVYISARGWAKFSFAELALRARLRLRPCKVAVSRPPSKSSKKAKRSC